MTRSPDHVHSVQRRLPHLSKPRTRLARCLAASALAGLAPVAQAQTDSPRALPAAAISDPAASGGATYSTTLQPIVVIATMPLVGKGLPLSQVAANVQVVHACLVDANTAYQATKRLRVVATVTNVFNRRYASFGALGRNFFNGPGHTFDGAAPSSEPFVGPGAPRGAWTGVRYAWD